MPLTKNVSENISELYKDNKKEGKARGAGGKVRSRKQIIAIAMSAAGKSKKKHIDKKEFHKITMDRLKERSKTG